MPTNSKRKSSTNTSTDWTEVIAKALAYLAVNSDQLKTKNVGERGAFLIGLGLPYSDAAHLLGSTEASLRELLRVANKAGKRPGARRTSQKTKAARLSS
jgi:hypothetical protein